MLIFRCKNFPETSLEYNLSYPEIFKTNNIFRFDIFILLEIYESIKTISKFNISLKK